MIALVWRIPDRRIELVWRVLGNPSRLREVDEISKEPGVLIGRRGPPGPPGSGASVQIDQTTPAGTWILTHGFGRRPLVQVFLTGGEQVIADVSTTDTQVTVVFATPTAGYVMLS